MQDNFNIGKLVEELDAEFAQEDLEPVVEEVVEESEEVAEESDSTEDIVVEEEEDEFPEEVTEEEDEPAADIMEEDLHKRNEAFKKLREERDQLAASDKFLTELASQYGLTKEQLVERFSQQQQEKMAKKEGISPEQYRKMQELEDKVSRIEEEKRREVFNVRAEAFANKYNLDENQLVEIFTEANRIGVDVTANPALLDVVYRSMTYDRAVEEGRQKQLETTKKRKQTSVGKTGTTGAQVNTTEADWDKEIDSVLKEQNLIK